MKTEKFSIFFEGLDTLLSTEIMISKAEYKRQFTFLMNQVKDTEHSENPVEYRAYTHDLENRIITQHVFAIGTSTTFLTARCCKEGYYFK